MRVLILGASGKTGRPLVEQAAHRGHTVTAFVRDPSKFHAPQGVRVVQGDVTDAGSLAKAVAGQEAVLCVLGQRSPFRRDHGLNIGMGKALHAMIDAGVRRLIYLSFAGVPESRGKSGPVLRYVMAPLLRAVADDHAEREHLIGRSGVSHTIVRAVMLTNGRHTGVFRYGETIKSLPLVPRIARADVAELMLRLLTEPWAVGKAYLVSY
jgi:uncharacterized protein YbjT (DUF2867 family)